MSTFFWDMALCLWVLDATCQDNEDLNRTAAIA
jgi:hypothetical protein